MSPTDDAESPAGNALQQDDLVDRLRPSPADPAPKVLELRGYLGRDSDAGYWRLYLCTDLADYLRIAEADIVDFQRPDGPGANLKPSHVILRAAAEVEYVTADLLENQVSFLSGEYTAALPESTQAALAQAAASSRRKKRMRRGSAFLFRYPGTPGFPCQPQITIESSSCFCSVFCAVL
ncbi:hypothetical protein [Nocardia sp. SC052]|uniref:hypothetical protein n=1 Tax=Nocardia sichangensis TaxID=3385975 RepID=UPI0039A23D4C